jgi:hypothetical protein
MAGLFSRLGSAVLAAVALGAAPASAQEALPPLPPPPQPERPPARTVELAPPAGPIDFARPPEKPPLPSAPPPTVQPRKRGDMGALAAHIGFRGIAQRMNGTDHDSVVAVLTGGGNDFRLKK